MAALASKMDELPDELLCQIFSYLPSGAQAQVARVNRRASRLVLPILYYSVQLVDCYNESTLDDHDDTPMVRMLLSFVQNPALAAHVRELKHECHVVLPDWQDIPDMSFSETHLSRDPRTLCLLQRAISHMTSVRTLRVIVGHQNIVEGLLYGFFHPSRDFQSPVRRLWIESSSLSNTNWQWHDLSISTGLESLRMRRLPLLYPRGRKTPFFHRFERRGSLNTPLDPVYQTEKITAVENDIYDNLRHEYPPALWRQCSKASCIYCGRPSVESKKERNFLNSIVKAEESTLASITFDWLLNGEAIVKALTQYEPFFPRLKALQVRNAVEAPATLDGPLHQLDQSLLFGQVWLDFLQRHPNIECLAWPMESFIQEPGIITDNIRSVLSTLGSRLKELRVDAQVLPYVDDTSAALSHSSPQALKRQLQFVELVAPHMRSLEVLKIEGTIPAEVRYQLLQTLQHCPLQKVVVIGLYWAVTNTWGDCDYDDERFWKLEVTDPIPWTDTRTSNVIHPEGHEPAGQTALSPSSTQVAIPVLDMLSRFQASTITELKFCGFRGAPTLLYPSPKTHYELSFLKNFHNLRYLTTAVWIPTYHQTQDRSEDIYHFWNDEVLVDQDQTLGRDSQHIFRPLLMEYYHHDAIAKSVAKLIGPHLSTQACGRAGGIGVKVLMLLPSRAHGSEIYEVEVRLGINCKILGVVEVRGENHPVKLEEKLHGRRWF
ncbi:hypothetical protein MMC30_003019 [Trapelia coarctata]|nr:hypothetical protein [Trapelia coarctata]